MVGDVMIDRYFYGDVTRISPEAPVPINKINRTRSLLGGAGNVAANLAGLGCRVFLSGICGQDENKVLMESLLTQAGIDYGGIVACADRQTTTKLRVLGARQQMLRLDFEQVEAVGMEEEERIVAHLTGLLKQGLHGVIISDYGKGICTPSLCDRVIRLAKSAGVPVLIDPKGSDWTKYRGADFITPNVKEMGECAGMALVNEDAALAPHAQTARQKFAIANVVVTRSEKVFRCSERMICTYTVRPLRKRYLTCQVQATRWQLCF